MPIRYGARTYVPSIAGATASCCCAWSESRRDGKNSCSADAMKGGNPRATARSLREIAHGKLLAQGDTEMLWGWTSPAGQQRFKRRAELILSSAAIRPGQK